MVLTPLLYIYGVIWLIPDVLENQDGFLQFLAYALATWCVIGILSNMYLIRHRHSSIRFRFLKPPVIASEPESQLPQQSQSQVNPAMDVAHSPSSGIDAE